MDMMVSSDMATISLNEELFTVVVESTCIDGNYIELGERDFEASQEFIIGVSPAIVATWLTTSNYAATTAGDDNLCGLIESLPTYIVNGEVLDL